MHKQRPMRKRTRQQNELNDDGDDDRRREGEDDGVRACVRAIETVVWSCSADVLVLR